MAPVAIPLSITDIEMHPTRKYQWRDATARYGFDPSTRVSHRRPVASREAELCAMRPNADMSDDGRAQAAARRETTSAPEPALNRVWFDVGDLLWWPFDHLSGIQRVQLSVLCALRDAPPRAFEIRCCRYGSRDGFREVAESDIAACIARLSGGPTDKAGADTRSVSRRDFVRPVAVALAGLHRRLPEGLALLTGRVWIGLVDLLRAARDRAGRIGRSAGADNIPCAFKKGDLLLNLGSSWINSGYVGAVEQAKASHGILYAALIYDLIPWKHPRWFDYGTRLRFLPWARQTMRASDLIFAISENTRKDIEGFLASEGLAPPDIEVIRLGERPPPAGGTWEPPPDLRQAMAGPGFVLAVGTIEVRKNHRLLFDVWQELLRKHGNRVPALVWAGRGGWLNEDLMNRVAASRSLDGKLIILGGHQGTGVSESGLRFLYENCLFTLFPSWYEGWGLPVAESIAFGKYCIASDAASIPEVAGGLVDYHAPDDFAGCFDLVERAVLDPDYRSGREARIRTEYRPYSWADCAQSICEKIVTWRNRCGEA